MRTKALLCAAALAAGALTSMAQVYSANVVGYVNVTVFGGTYNLLANPLINTAANGNNITNLFAGKAQNGDNIFRWNVGSVDFDGLVLSKGPAGWDSSFNANLGEAFFYVNNGSDFTVTFVGDVQQGSWTYPGQPLGGVANKLAGGYYSAIGAPVPLGGSVTNVILGLAPQNGDNIFTWNPASVDFDGVVNTKGPAGWDNPQVQVAPGLGVFYVNNGSDLTWTATFTVH